MKRFTPYLFVLATAAATVACGKSDMEVRTTSDADQSTSPAASAAYARGMSLVRVVNAVEGGEVVSVELRGQPLFPTVAAGAVTAYQQVALNLADFTVHVEGWPDGMMLAEKDRLLLDGNRYTVMLVADDATKRSLRVVGDDVIPDSGKARVRVLNAAPNSPALDVTVAGSKGALFTGVAFKQGGGYSDVQPGAVTLEFRGTGKTNVLLTVRGLNLRRGTATTVVVSGTNALTYFTFEDALMAPAPKTP